MVRCVEKSASTYRQLSTCRRHQGQWNVEPLHFRQERRVFQSKPRSGSCGPADDPEVLGLLILALRDLREFECMCLSF